MLLANKLDDLSTLSYFATVSPLFVTFLTLMLMSFSSKPNNHCEFSVYHCKTTGIKTYHMTQTLSVQRFW